MSHALPPTLFKQLAPLNCLSEHRLSELLTEGRAVQIAAGKTVFHTDALAKKAFFLLAGTLQLQDATGHCIPLRPDSGLEIARAQAGLRHCSALTDSIVFSVDRQLLEQVVCWSETQKAHALDLALKEDTDVDSAWKQALLYSNLFNKVPSLNIAMIYQLLKPMRVAAGEYIIRQGDAGDACYFLRQGEAEVLRVNQNGSSEVLSVIGYGRCIGEDALIHDTLRNASVRMLTDGVLYRLDKQDFYQLLRLPVLPSVAVEKIDSADSSQLLLDVRSEQEAAASGLQASNVPLAALPLYLQQNREYLASLRQILVYCDSGQRSQAAVLFLQQAGLSACWLQGSLAA